MKKQFNFKIWNYLNKSFSKHEPLYTKQSISFLFLNQIEFFYNIGNVKWNVTKFILAKKGAMCKKSISFEILNV
jgi:glutathione peroxidase-family protein